MSDVITEGFPLNFNNKYEIDVSSGEEEEGNYKVLAAGITSVEPEFEDEEDDSVYYDGQGFGSNDVTSIKASLVFTGHRKYGDEAQDYIAGLLFELGENRKTRLRWTQPDGAQIVGEVTISGIKPGGGEAAEKSEFEFTATFNGRPELTIA